MLHRPSLGAATRKCEAHGCNSQAGTLGYCSIHATEHINADYEKAVASGHAAPKAPACFTQEADYREYVVLFMASMGVVGVKARSRIDHCRDCNPSFQQQMLRSGQCWSPETVFIREDRTGGDLVGVGSTDLRRWEMSVIGALGPVVKAPEASVVANVFEQIGINNAMTKRKPGRPKKAN